MEIPLSALVGLVVITAAVYYGQKALNRKVYKINVAETMDRFDELKDHAKEFNAKEVLKVNENIYMAIGYALANSIMIVGPERVVIVDVTESYHAAQEIYKEFRTITDKPITDMYISYVVEQNIVNENIYMAIGYALANSIMIVGPEGAVIVDVTESYHAAQEIYKEFRKITDKPITDIVYTHNHQDHIGGAMAFIEHEKSLPTIWAHSSMVKALEIWYTRGTNIIYFIRALRQFGVHVPDLSAGIGFKLAYGKKGSKMAPMFPNRFVDGSEEDVTLAGLPMKIVHIPGETDDQIGVWMPQHKAFMCADDLYKAFPNLYAIRGTTNRNTLQWVSSMDKMIDLEPEMLVPSHTRPIIGKEKVMSLLIDYRDAIQFVHDQTVRLANTGYHPNEISRELRLPEKLSANPFLKEFYGTVAWSAKSVFLDYLGWFSGDPVDLSPLTSSEKSERMVDLAGVDRLVEVARDALEAKDFQWALELSTHVIKSDPSHSEARKINVEALVSLGSRQTSANGRHYYLTSAMEAANEVKIEAVEGGMATIIDAFPLTMTLKSFSILFKTKECEKREETLYLKLTDTESHHYIQLRNGVAIVKDRAPKAWTIKLECSEKTWKDVMAGRKNIISLIKSGDIKAEGTNVAIASFLGCFDKDLSSVGL